MKILDKITEIINERVLIILLEFTLFTDNISSGRPILAIIWLVLAISNIIILASEKEDKE